MKYATSFFKDSFLIPLGEMLDQRPLFFLNSLFAHFFRAVYPRLIFFSLMGKVKGSFLIECRNSILGNNFNLFFSDVDLAFVFKNEQTEEDYQKIIRRYQLMKKILPNLGEFELYLQSEWQDKLTYEASSPQLVQIRTLRKIFWTNNRTRNSYDRAKRSRFLRIQKQQLGLTDQATDLNLAEALIHKIANSVPVQTHSYLNELQVFHPFIGASISCGTKNENCITISAHDFYRFFSLITLNVFEDNYIEELRRTEPIRSLWLEHMQLEKIIVKNIIRSQSLDPSTTTQWLSALDERLDLYFKNHSVPDMPTNISKTWCPLPWFNLNSNTDGRVKLCCSIVENEHVREHNQEMNFARDPIEKIWNSSYLRKIRKEMLEGQKPKACSVCWKLEEEGATSSRQTALQQYNNLVKNSKQDILSDLPCSLELRLGNKCNLKCMSCWSLSSSSIFEERKQSLQRTDLDPNLISRWTHEIKQTSQCDLNWHATEEFKTSFKKMAPSLKRLYLTGGEPTLIAENLEFFKALLDAGNTSCHVRFTTNATVWNPELYALLSQFDSSEVQISLDGFGEMNEYIRFPSRWPVIEKNLDRIFALPEKVSLKIFTVVSLLNADSVIDLTDWLLKKYKARPFLYAPILLQSPDFLSTSLLTEEYRQNIIAELEVCIRKIKSSLGPTHQIEYGLENIQKHLRVGVADEARKKQIQIATSYIDSLEKIRLIKHPRKQMLFEKGLSI